MHSHSYRRSLHVFVHAHALSQFRLFDVEQNQWSNHCRPRICWAVIMGLTASNKSFPTTSKYSNGTKPSVICIKLVGFHIYLSDEKVKAMVETLAGDWTLTDLSIGIISDCKQDSSHELLCDSFSFNIAYHGKEEGLKERVLDIAKQSQEHCSTVKETTNLISNLAPPQNMKSRETDQDKVLHCANLEVWSNISKWGQERAASTITSSCSPSGSETSSYLSTMEMSTLSCQSEASSFSFNWREKEKEPLSGCSSLDSSLNITLSSTKHSQEHCSTVKETTNLISNLAPPQNMKSRETDQDKVLHCANLEVWSNISKWGQEGAASTITSSCSPSGSETSSYLSTMEMSTLSCQSEASSFSFNWREKEKEPLSGCLSLDSSLNITLSSTMMSKASLTHKGLKKMNVSVDGYKEIITTPPHIKTAKGHVEKISSPLGLHDDKSIWSPQICVRPKNVTTKVLWPPTIFSPTSKKINQSNRVSRRSLSNVPERSVKFVAPDQEKVSEDAFKSTTEAKSSHSSRVTLSRHPCNKQGILHYVCKDGIPYYTFSLNECGEALVAKACKLSICTEDLDWIYTFHSSKDNKKKCNKNKWIRKDKHTPDLVLVGWMSVCSSLHPQFNTTGSLEHTLETEFVLFSAGSKHHHTIDNSTVQDKTVHSTTSNQLDYMTSASEISFDIFSQSTPPTTPMSTWPTSPKPEMIKKIRLDDPSWPPSCDISTLNSLKSRSADGNTTTLENRGNADSMSEAEFCALQPYSAHLESSAIVIRTPFSQSKSTAKVATEKDSAFSKDCGGWGLKFLEKSSRNLPSKHAFHCQQKQYSNISARSSTDRCIFDDRLCCGKHSESSITAMIPADLHGLPSTKSSGPSSLVERWKLDGKCDCGGWDLGCPIILLHNQRQSIVNSNSNSMPQDCHSLHALFKEGQEDTPALSMSAVDKGLYAISFESQLSDLQVFSICLALLHDRERDIPVPPFRNKSRESYLRSSTRSPLRASRQVFSVPTDRDIGNQPSLRSSWSSIG